MSYRVILPSIYQPYTDDCLATMSEEVRKHTIVRNNIGDNIGVSKSWNIGVDEVLQTGAQWLVLLSAAIRFKQGGNDLIDYLNQHPHLDVVESTGVFGWHLIAFNRRVFEAVGRFDENFFNYFGDIDWSLRIQKGMPNVKWEKTPVDVEDMGMAHGIKLAGVIDPADKNILYFVEKWGRHPGAYQLGSYDRPFNNPDNGLDYWPTVNFIGGNL